jgi:hypothetical protein
VVPTGPEVKFALAAAPTAASEARRAMAACGLVDEMADRWGVHHQEHETCVWFELACAD